MNALEKKESYGVLLLIYGNLLSDTIEERLREFYLEDYSITEISEMHSVSRNAVFESISIGEKKLDDYEKKLGLKNKNDKAMNYLDRLAKTDDPKEKEKLVQLLKGVLDYGI